MRCRGEMVTISPGEWHFGHSPIVVSTLLGSCIAVTAWHSRLLCGGMCHYLLPSRSIHKELEPANPAALNPRYGKDALELLAAQLKQYGALEEFTFGYFGGATMFKGNNRIGEANCELAQDWLRSNNVYVVDVSVGGTRGRKVALDIATGKISASELNSIVVGETNGHQRFGSG